MTVQFRLSKWIRYLIQDKNEYENLNFHGTFDQTASATTQKDVLLTLRGENKYVRHLGDR